MMMRPLTILFWATLFTSFTSSIYGKNALTLPKDPPPLDINEESLQEEPNKLELNKPEIKTKTVHTPPPSTRQLIIYQNGFCLVKDKRRVALREGYNKLILQEIPKLFLEDSLLIRSLDELPLIYTELSFHSDILTFQNVLNKSVGKNVWVTQNDRAHPAPQVSGHLLAIDKGKALLKIGSRIEMVPLDRIAFQSIPLSLSIHPLLYLNVKSPVTQESDLELIYMTQGFSWKANYTVEINPEKSRANMMGWVSINNTSGVKFKKARIQLASSQNFLSPDSAANGNPQLYPLPVPISLYHDATKKVSFLSATQIDVSREYRISLPPIPNAPREAVTPLKTKIWFSILNKQKNNLGFLLPAGEVKIYANSSTQMRYAGTISIKHTAVGDTLSVPLETCYLVDAHVNQIDFKQLGTAMTESAFRVTITNKNNKPIQITLMQKLPPHTTLTRSSLDTYSTVHDTVFWPISIPSNQTVSLRFRVRTVADHKDTSKTEGLQKSLSTSAS